MPTPNLDYDPDKRGKSKPRISQPISTPKGTISASSHQLGNYPHHSVDGEKTTRWAASDGTTPQWIQLDFGVEKPLSGAEIRFNNRTKIRYHVSVSSDGVKWTKVHESNKASEIQDERLSFSATARYLRITVEAVESGWVTIQDWQPIHPPS